MHYPRDILLWAAGVLLASASIVVLISVFLLVARWCGFAI